MRLFRRSRKSSEDVPDPRTAWPEQPVPEDAAAAAVTFWEAWFALLPEVSAALGDREPHRVEHDLCTIVEALHPRLHFSLDRGHRAIYSLVLTGQEDPELRPYTDAWKAAAPPEDAIWEYHDSVPPVPDPSEVTVNLGETRIALADVRVTAKVDESAGRVDVTVFHPLIGELQPDTRMTMTFLPLDATLGERVAAERLGRVELATEEQEGRLTLLELREVVARLDPRASGIVGTPD
ncbi:hypothetical protein [Amycolatopsis pittospori]|uniref:hypothetical protein n=1 Tax=Amycolatopsis pittospori TaxID=2749434 RepID=UPI0015F0CF46|nr:hypothetical protein [Amycolatopsis pittospori]